MDESIDSVTVVGGGDAGLLCALSLRKMNPEMAITVVDDFAEPQTAVGKSTFQAILTLLHDFLEIDEARFLREVKPVWKGSVFFRDWCGCDPFHYAFDIRSVKPSVFDPRSSERLYYYYRTKNITTPGEQLVERRKSPLAYSPTDGRYPQYPKVAYHLSIGRFNSLLQDLCNERGVELIDDRVTTIAIDDARDRIEEVKGERGSYVADLYVDATGFKRLLIGELDSTFETFDIPLDTALHATAALSIEDIVPATVVETGEYGWFWQIDTLDSRDLGYVYSSAHVSEERAIEEFEDRRPEKLGEIETYRFDSGCYREAWVGNCAAMGNALGFIEPLQSTALTTHLKTSLRLACLLAAHGRVPSQGVRESFNSYARGAWNSVYDFISVHYAYSNGATQFWEEMRSIPLSEKVHQYIEYFDRNGLELFESELVTEDGTELDMITFSTTGLYLIMVHMGANSTFYEHHPPPVDSDLDAKLRRRNEAVTELVEGCLSYEEVYRSGVVDSYERDERGFKEALELSRAQAREGRPQS